MATETPSGEGTCPKVILFSVALWKMDVTCTGEVQHWKTSATPIPLLRVTPHRTSVFTW